MKNLNMSDFLIEAGMRVLNEPRDMSAYDGKPFQCACGKIHDFQSWMDFRNFVTNGLNAKMMITCPNGQNISTIIKTKYKFLVVFDHFESIAGFSGE